MSNSPKVQQNFNAPVYGVTEKIVKDQVVEFSAWVFPDGTYKELLIKEISIRITPELAERSGKFDDTNYCCVYIAPEIFEKFIITKIGSNYKIQTIDVPRLLECWETLGFPLYIKKN